MKLETISNINKGVSVEVTSLRDMKRQSKEKLELCHCDPRVIRATHLTMDGR